MIPCVNCNLKCNYVDTSVRKMFNNSNFLFNSPGLRIDNTIFCFSSHFCRELDF